MGNFCDSKSGLKKKKKIHIYASIWDHENQGLFDYSSKN